MRSSSSSTWGSVPPSTRPRMRSAMARPIELKEMATMVPPPKSSTIARRSSRLFMPCLADQPLPLLGHQPFGEVEAFLGLTELLLHVVQLVPHCQDIRLQVRVRGTVPPL